MQDARRAVPVRADEQRGAGLEGELDLVRRVDLDGALDARDRARVEQVREGAAQDRGREPDGVGAGLGREGHLDRVHDEILGEQRGTIVQGPCRGHEVPINSTPHVGIQGHADGVDGPGFYIRNDAAAVGVRRQFLGAVVGPAVRAPSLNVGHDGDFPRHAVAPP